jgi:hypothetical protein
MTPAGCNILLQKRLNPIKKEAGRIGNPLLYIRV